MVGNGGMPAMPGIALDQMSMNPPTSTSSIILNTAVEMSPISVLLQVRLLVRLGRRGSAPASSIGSSASTDVGTDLLAALARSLDLCGEEGTIVSSEVEGTLGSIHEDEELTNEGPDPLQPPSRAPASEGSDVVLAPPLQTSSEGTPARFKGGLAKGPWGTTKGGIGAQKRRVLYESVRERVARELQMMKEVEGKPTQPDSHGSTHLADSSIEHEQEQKGDALV